MSEDLDKIIATASSALNKRLEYQKILNEKKEIEEQLGDENLDVEKVTNLIDKGIILSKKLISFGNSDDAILLLSNLLVAVSKFELNDFKNAIIDDITKISENALKEAIAWENFNEALMYALICDVLANYSSKKIVEEIEKELLKIEENLERIRGDLIKLKNEISALLVNPNSDAMSEISRKYEDNLKSSSEKKLLKTVINLLKALS